MKYYILLQIHFCDNEVLNLYKSRKCGGWTRDLKKATAFKNQDYVEKYFHRYYGTDIWLRPFGYANYSVGIYIVSDEDIKNGIACMQPYQGINHPLYFRK